jgi:Tol biopolymer transport system component
MVVGLLALASCVPGGGSGRGLQNFIARHSECSPLTYSRPRWSPDGGSIAYLFSTTSSQNGGFSEIYRMNADGSANQHLYTNMGYPMWSLAWWPDGSRLVFDTLTTSLNVIDTQGGAPTLFITGKSQVMTPNFSRDGQHLAFASDRTGSWDIYFRSTRDLPPLIDMRRSDVALDLVLDAQGDEQAPAWSPDASHIVYASARSGGFDLYVLSVDSRVVQQLTDSFDDEYYPTWSPDGSEIVYSVGWGATARLAAIKPDGSGQLFLGDGAMPDWSPDGQRIAFVSERSGRAEIYTMRPDGGDVHRLTANPTPALCIH